MNRKTLMLVLILLLLLAAIPVAQAKTGRQIVGSVAFPSPAEWGVDLDLWIDFDLQEASMSNHKATGEITWRIWDEDIGWRVTRTHPSCVLFGEDVGEDPNTAIIVTRIQQTEGWGDGLPGEYAYWWVHDNGDNDQFAVLDYSLDPWYEFFPRGKPPVCVYFEPWLKIDMGDGLEIIH